MRPLEHHGTREMAELSTAFLDMAREAAGALGLHLRPSPPMFRTS